jgi:hypothetical protein
MVALARRVKLIALLAVAAVGVGIAFAAGPWPVKAGGAFVALITAAVGVRDEVVYEIDRRATADVHASHAKQLGLVGQALPILQSMIDTVRQMGEHQALQSRYRDWLNTPEGQAAMTTHTKFAVGDFPDADWYQRNVEEPTMRALQALDTEEPPHQSAEEERPETETDCPGC